MYGPQILFKISRHSLNYICFISPDDDYGYATYKKIVPCKDLMRSQILHYI